MYKYLGFSIERKPVKGAVDAQCKGNAVAELRRKGLYPILVWSGKERKEITIFGAKLKSKDLVAFNSSFYMLLNTGISDTECVKILFETLKSSRIKRKCKNLYSHLLAGNYIYQGMAYEGFPELMVSSIRAGEENGTLLRILRSLSGRYDSEKKLEERLRQAMIYPAVLLFMALGTFIFASLYIIPSFAEIFYDFGVEPPAAMQAAINIREFVTEYWLYFVVGIPAFIWAMYFAWKIQILRLCVHTVALRIPVIKDIIQKISVSRFAGILSILLEGEVFLLEALQISADTIQNEAYKRSIYRITDKIEQGNSFESAIQADRLYPAYLASLLEVSGETGDYREMLERGGEIYDREANSAIQSLVTILEPAGLILMGLLALFLAFSVIMPMYDILDSIEL